MLGDIDPETTVFVLGLLELLMYGGTYDQGMRSYPSRVALALRTPGLGSANSEWSLSFHTVRGGIDPEDCRFSPRFVEVVNIWRDF